MHSLSNKTIAFQGEPTTVPAPVKATITNREMLATVPEAALDAVRGYTERAKEAEA